MNANQPGVVTPLGYERVASSLFDELGIGHEPLPVGSFLWGQDHSSSVPQSKTSPKHGIGKKYTRFFLVSMKKPTQMSYQAKIG